MITRQEFIDQFGEAPEDVLGMDWENEIRALEDWAAEEHTINQQLACHQH